MRDTHAHSMEMTRPQGVCSVISALVGEGVESTRPARSHDLKHDRLCDVIWARSRERQTLSRGQDGEVLIGEKQTSVGRRAAMRLCEGTLSAGCSPDTGKPGDPSHQAKDIEMGEVIRGLAGQECVSVGGESDRLGATSICERWLLAFAGDGAVARGEVDRGLLRTSIDQFRGKNVLGPRRSGGGYLRDEPGENRRGSGDAVSAPKIPTGQVLLDRCERSLSTAAAGDGGDEGVALRSLVDYRDVYRSLERA